MPDNDHRPYRDNANPYGSPASATPKPGVPSRFSRRHFIAGAGVTTAGVLAAGLAITRPWQSALGTGTGVATGRGPLVVVTLYGGNDGLNTVIPYTDGAYLSARPTLGYQPSQVLELADGLALNPKLPGLHNLWKSGNLAVVRGVGYPDPNLSHFASMAIWQTANVTDGSGPGWLGRWLDVVGDGTERAVSVGATLPPMLRGEKEAAAAITGPSITLPGDAAFGSAYAAMQAAGPDRAGLSVSVASAGAELLALQHELATLNTHRAGSSGTTAAAALDLSGQLAAVADLVNGGYPANVYQVSLESFDSHADERANHERLLGELDAAIGSFFKAVEGNPRSDDIVLMTVSEFGRRPAQNASGGTDHGTAAPLFVAGPRVRGGRFYGDEPSLAALDENGNLRYSTDFRQVYATVLERVLGADSEQVLGGRFQTLDFV